MPLDVDVSAAELWQGVELWLDLLEPAFCRLSAYGTAAARAPTAIPPSSRTFASTFGVCDGIGLALFTSDVEGRVAMRAYGAEPELARRLHGAVIRWVAAGRPMPPRTRFEARFDGRAPEGADLVLYRPSCLLGVRWHG
jgi:protein-L-isoaspartate(D-aspartate) O-methyltransferase